jgi:hypothetical protein
MRMTDESVGEATLTVAQRASRLSRAASHSKNFLMSDIFISYTHEDRPRAQALAQTVEDRGWSTFWDRTIPAGKTWRETIGRELADAHCVIVLWSKISIESDWVAEEADDAKRRRVLVPVLIDDIEPPLGFRSIQAADLVDWDGTEPTLAFRRLMADIAARIGPPSKEAKNEGRQVEAEIERNAEEERRRAEAKKRAPSPVAMPKQRPVCLTIMPSGRKPTHVVTGLGPAEVDFNALWDRGYVPVIQALGYQPVRADQDTGALIITQMLERLYFADLLLADMTTANGNVLYELGIRHAAKDKGCVLLAADWSGQPFDLAQMRTVRYPLPEGMITEQTAQAFSNAVKGEIQRRAGGDSPMYMSISGYPSNVDEQAASTMKDQMAQLALFQADLRTVRAVPQGTRMTRARELVAAYSIPTMLPTIALELLLLLRDSVDKSDDWEVVLDFIGKLPDELAMLAQVREQRAFAHSYTGKNLDAVAEIGELIQTFGPTPERLGLLGGRFKRLYASATTPQEQLAYLNKSIESYEQGMDLDLNAYYCAANLPRLYRARNRKDDEERARSTLNIVLVAGDRAKRRGTGDEWLRPTLLDAAFDLGDASKAEELCDEVVEEGPALWKIDIIVHDLEGSVSQVEDDDRRKRLSGVIARLKTL